MRWCFVFGLFIINLACLTFYVCPSFAQQHTPPDFKFPLKGSQSEKYGWYIQGGPGYYETHPGDVYSIDIDNSNDPTGESDLDKVPTPVIAAASGKVKVVVGKDSGGFGKHVIIEHKNGYQTVYAHLDSVSVKEGQVVKLGDELGILGTTGSSTGLHLHFEVRYNNNNRAKKLEGVALEGVKIMNYKTGQYIMSTNATETNFEQEVRKWYEKELGSPPDEEGQEFWVGKLRGSGGDVQGIKNDFVNTPEFKVELAKRQLKREAEKRAAKIKKLRKEAAEAEAEAERIASLKGQFIETLKGIPKAFDDLEHGRLEGTLPQTIYDVSKSILQTVASMQGYSVYLHRDLEMMQKALDSTGSIAHGQPNWNVSTVSLVSPDFSDNFSAGLGNWSFSNAFTASTFGPLTSPDGSVFGIIHTGLGDPANTGLLSKQFDLTVPLDLNISFKYNFVTNEYPVWVGSIFNDSFTAELHTPGGGTVNLAGETLNSSTFTSVSGLPTNVLDNSTGGETGWKTVNTTLSVPSGTSELHFHVKDVGDNILDAATLIDDVSLK